MGAVGRDHRNSARFLSGALVALVAVHWGIVAAVPVSVCLCWICEPPWVSLLVTLWAVQAKFAPIRGACPLVAVENAIRRRLGKPEIEGFVRHYIHDRLRVWRDNLRERAR